MCPNYRMVLWTQEYTKLNDIYNNNVTIIAFTIDCVLSI